MYVNVSLIHGFPENTFSRISKITDFAQQCKHVCEQEWLVSPPLHKKGDNIMFCIVDLHLWSSFSVLIFTIRHKSIRNEFHTNHQNY